MYKAAIGLGVNKLIAAKLAAHGRSWWRTSSRTLNQVLPGTWFDSLSLPRLS
jgi:hypothetical protein